MAALDRTAILRLYTLPVVMMLGLPRAHSDQYPDVNIFLGDAQVIRDWCYYENRTFNKPLYLAEPECKVLTCLPKEKKVEVMQCGEPKPGCVRTSPPRTPFPECCRTNCTEWKDICQAPEIKARTEFGERGLTGQTGPNVESAAANEPCELVQCINGNFTVQTFYTAAAKQKARNILIRDRRHHQTTQR
ncbi:uncharacterized protein [Dermacentor albipictus]|uniref:uncharacterized protein n=1 Tax=Dermacentor albipictus TaxID=60249 RepID=UPI0038FC9B2F